MLLRSDGEANEMAKEMWSSSWTSDSVLVIPFCLIPKEFQKLPGEATQSDRPISAHMMLPLQQFNQEATARTCVARHTVRWP